VKSSVWGWNVFKKGQLAIINELNIVTIQIGCFTNCFLKLIIENIWLNIIDFKPVFVKDLESLDLDFPFSWRFGPLRHSRSLFCYYSSSKHGLITAKCSKRDSKNKFSLLHPLYCHQFFPNNHYLYLRASRPNCDWTCQHRHSVYGIYTLHYLRSFLQMENQESIAYCYLCLYLWFRCWSFCAFGFNTL